MKKVQILMATYNGEKYLKQQLDSILSQTKADWELLIRDDGSSDRTLEIILYYVKRDKRIKLINDNKGNLGYKRNFEELLKHSTGEYLFFSDQDDIWRREKLEICLKYLKKYTIIHHNAEVFNEIAGYPKYILEVKKKNTLKTFCFPVFIGCCMAFRRDILKIVLPIPENYPAHDSWIGLLGILNKNIYFLEDILIEYRRHGNNTSFLSEKSKNSLRIKLKFRYYYCLYPLLRVIAKKILV